MCVKRGNNTTDPTPALPAVNTDKDNHSDKDDNSVQKDSSDKEGSIEGDNISKYNNNEEYNSDRGPPGLMRVGWDWPNDNDSVSDDSGNN